jgi:hypothetical protein
MTSEDSNVTASLGVGSPAEQVEGGQREASLKVGAEFLPAALGAASAPSSDLTSGHRLYSSDKTPSADRTPSPSPDLVIEEPVAARQWLALRSRSGPGLVPGNSADADRLLGILSQELCRAVTAADLVASHGLLIIDDELDASSLQAKLQDLEYEAIVAPLPPAFEQEPLEVLSIDIGEEDMIVNSVEMGRLRVPLNSVVAVQEASVRLSRRESAQAREIIELVTQGSICRRLQLHERTFSLHNSKHAGEPLVARTFAALGQWLEQRFGQPLFARAESELSYEEHEASLKRRILLRN